MTLSQTKTKVIIYRDYQNFWNDKFRAELDNGILQYDVNNREYQHFLNILTKILSKHGKKYLGANQGRLMTKELHKAIKNRSRLRYNFLGNKTEILRKEHKNNEVFVAISCENPKIPFCKTWYIFCHRQHKFLANCKTFFFKQSKIS